MTELQKLEQQVAELQATIERMKEPEFIYPMWFRANKLGYIARFDSERNGELLEDAKISTRELKKGYKFSGWMPHTDADFWTQVPEPAKQWEPQSGKWFIDSCGDVIDTVSYEASRLFGTEYKTKEQAEWARDQMRRFNRLLCYVAEHTDGTPKDIHISCNDARIVNVKVITDESINMELWDKIKSGEVVL